MSNRFLIEISVLVASTASVARADSPRPAPPAPPVPAESPPADTPTEPWAEDVPEATRTEANVLFNEGNELYMRDEIEQAVDKYRAAVLLWDHPMIRFNLAVAEVRLDRVLDASNDIDHALRFGNVPFTPALYRQALAYQKLIEAQVAHVDVRCEQAGTQVWLDGKTWFICPGKQTKRVVVGEHHVVGERLGHVPASRRVMLKGGGTEVVHLQLETIESATVYEYPVRPWIPWTSAAVGAAIGLTGAGIWIAGRNQIDDFNERFATACAAGCRSDLSDQPLLADQLARGRTIEKVGITTLVIGAAAALGGVTWGLLFNQPYRVMPTVEPTSRGASAQVTVHW